MGISLKNRFSYIFVFSILIFCGSVGQSYGQISVNGGRGLFRITSAETINPGNLYISSFGSAYLRKSGSSLAKDYHMSVVFTYGIFSFLEFDTRFVAYQDDQSHIWGPIGDTQLGLKLKIPIESRFIALGVGSKVIFPTAPDHNVPYEAFSADGIGWTPEAYATFNLTDLFLYPLKLYLNTGYMDHKLLDGMFANKIDETYFDFGLKFPVKSTIVYWELDSRQLIHRSHEVAFQENWIYSHQGIVFVGPYNLIMNASLDWNLTKDDPATTYQPKEYARWKLWLGVTKYISLKKYATEALDKRRKQKEKMGMMKRQEEFRKQRSKADEEITRMQEMLKKQEKKKKPNK